MLGRPSSVIQDHHRRTAMRYQRVVRRKEFSFSSSDLAPFGQNDADGTNEPAVAPQWPSVINLGLDTGVADPSGEQGM